MALRSKPGAPQLRKITVAQRKKVGAQWMIVGEGGVIQVGGLDSLARSLNCLEALGAARGLSCAEPTLACIINDLILTAG
jgi:hypothetical protein